MPTAYHHVEVGCGNGKFGARFYEPCLTTDVEWSSSISVVTDAHSLALTSDSFTGVILCNPYGYGFIREAGARLMEELLRVLRPGGTIVVIGASANPNCQVDRIRGIAEALSTPEAMLTVEVEKIVAAELENHLHAIAIHYMHYNFARVQKGLKGTPAMAAGVSNHVWSVEEIVGLLDTAETKAA